MNTRTRISSGQHNLHPHFTFPLNSFTEYSDASENSQSTLPKETSEKKEGEEKSGRLLRRMRRSNDLSAYDKEILDAEDISILEKTTFRYASLKAIQELPLEKIAKLTASQIENISTPILESMPPQWVATIHPQTWMQLDSRTRATLIHYSTLILNDSKKQQGGQEFLNHYARMKNYLITLPGTHLAVLEDRVFHIFEPTDLLQILTPEKISHIAPEKIVKISKNWSLLTPQHVEAMDPKVFSLASSSQLTQLSLESRRTISPLQLSQVNLNVIPDWFLLELTPQQVRALGQKVSQIPTSLFANTEAIQEHLAAVRKLEDAKVQLLDTVHELNSLLNDSWEPAQAERIRTALWKMEDWRMRTLIVGDPVLDDQGHPVNARIEFETAHRIFQNILNEVPQPPEQMAKFQAIWQKIQNKGNKFLQRRGESSQAEAYLWTMNQALAEFMLALDETQITELNGRQIHELSSEGWDAIFRTLEIQAQRHAEVQAPLIARQKALQEARENGKNSEWALTRIDELIEPSLTRINKERFIELAKNFFEKFQSMQFSSIKPEIVDMWNIPGWANVLEVIALSRMLSTQSLRNYSKVEIQKISDAVLQDMKEKGIPFLERLTLQQIDWLTQDDDGKSTSIVYNKEEIQAARNRIQENNRSGTLLQLSFLKLRADQLDGVSPKAVQDFLRSPNWINFVSDEVLVAIIRKYVDNKNLLGADFYIQCAQNAKFHIIPTEIRQKIDPAFFKTFHIDNFWQHLLPFIKLENNFVPTKEQFFDVITGLKSDQLAECLPLFKILAFAILPFVSADNIHRVPAEAFRYLGELPPLTPQHIKNMELGHFAEMSPKVFAQLWSENNSLLSSIRPKILKQLPLNHYSQLSQYVSDHGTSFSQIWIPKQYGKLPDQLFFEQMIHLNETPGRCLQKLTKSQFSAWLQGQPPSTHHAHSLPLKTILNIEPKVFASIANKGPLQAKDLSSRILQGLPLSYYQALYDHVLPTERSFDDLWVDGQLSFLPSQVFSNGWINPKQTASDHLRFFTSAQWDAWLSSHPDNDLKWLKPDALHEFHRTNLSSQFLLKLSEAQMRLLRKKELQKIPQEVMQQFIASTPEADQRIEYLISEGIVTEENVKFAKKNAVDLSQNKPTDSSIADSIRQVGQNPDPATVQIVKEAYQKAQQVQQWNTLEQGVQELSNDVTVLEVEARQKAQKVGDSHWILLPGTLQKDSPEVTLFHQKTQESLKVPLNDQKRINRVTDRMKTLQEFFTSFKAASKTRGGKLAGFGIGAMSTVQFWLNILSSPDKIQKLPVGLQLSIYWNLADTLAGWAEDGLSVAHWGIKKFRAAAKGFISFANQVTRQNSPVTSTPRDLFLAKASVQYFPKNKSSLVHGFQKGLSKIGPYLSTLNRFFGGVSLGTSIGDLSTAQTRDEQILAGTNLGFNLLALGIGHLAGSVAAGPLILAGISINIIVDTKLGMDRAIKQYQSRADEARDFLEIWHRLYKQPSKYQENILSFQNARLRKIDLSNGEIITNSQLVHTLRMKKNQQTGQYEHYYLPPKKLADIYDFSESTLLSENEAQQIQVVRLPDNTKQENLLIEEADTYLPEQRYSIERNYPATTPEQRHTEEILKRKGMITGPVRSLISRDQQPTEKDVPLSLKAPAHRNMIWMVPFEAKENKASYELETHSKGALNMISYYAHGIHLKLKDPADVTTPSLIQIHVGDAQLFPQEGLKVENREGKKLLLITHHNNQTSEIDISEITDSVVQIIGRQGIWNIYPDGKIYLQGCITTDASDEVTLRQLEKENRMEEAVKIYPASLILKPPTNSLIFTSTATKDGVTTKITKITNPKTTTITTHISGHGTANPYGGPKTHTEVIPTPVDDPIHQQVQELYKRYLTQISVAHQTTTPRVFIDGKIIKSDKILPGAQFIENSESKDYYFFFHAPTGTLQRIRKLDGEESRCQLPIKNGVPTQLVQKGEQISFKYFVPYGTEGKRVVFAYQWTDEGPQLTAVEGVIVEQDLLALPNRPTGTVSRNLSIKIPNPALANLLKQAGIEPPLGRAQTHIGKGVKSWIHFIGQDVSGTSYNFDAHLKSGRIILMNKEDRFVAELSNNLSKGRIYHSPKEQSVLFVKLLEEEEAGNNRQQLPPRIMDVREITHTPGANLVCLISANGKITLWNPFADTKAILPEPRIERVSERIPLPIIALPAQKQSERDDLSTPAKMRTRMHPAPLLIRGTV